MAYAASLFTDSLIRGLEGERDVYEYAYTMNNVAKVPYFATRVHLGKNGIDEIIPLSAVWDYEEESIRRMIPILQKQIDKGVAFGKSYKIQKD